MSFLQSLAQGLKRLPRPQIFQQQGQRVGTAVFGTLAVEQINGDLHDAKLEPVIDASGTISIEQSPQQSVDSTTVTDVMPRSIEILTQAEVPVPADLLLKELSWEELLSGPLMQDAEYANIRDEIVATKKRLDDCMQHEYTLSAEHSTQIVKKFWSWLSLHATASVLNTTEEVHQVVSDALSESGICLDSLRKKHDAIKDAIEQQEWSRADKMSQRAILACDRIGQMLRAIKRQVLRAQEKSNERLKTCLSVAGGAIIIGIAVDYLGYAPGVSSEIALKAIKETAFAGAVIAVAISTVQWVLSSDAAAYLDKLEAAEINRMRMKNRLEEMVDKIVFSGH